MLQHLALFNKHHLIIYGPLSPTIPIHLCEQMNQLKMHSTTSWKCEMINLTIVEKIAKKVSLYLTKEDVNDEIVFLKIMNENKNYKIDILSPPSIDKMSA